MQKEARATSRAFSCLLLEQLVKQRKRAHRAPRNPDRDGV